MNNIFDEQFTRTLEDAQMITEGYEDALATITELSNSLTGYRLKMAQYAIKILKNLFGPAYTNRIRRDREKANSVGHYRGQVVSSVPR
jgi:hypothetical protein